MQSKLQQATVTHLTWQECAALLRGLRGWRGGMTRDEGGQLRPCGFRDGGTVTSAETQGTRMIRRESDSLIVPKKPGNAGRGKGRTKYQPRKRILMQTGAEQH